MTTTVNATSLPPPGGRNAAPIVGAAERAEAAAAALISQLTDLRTQIIDLAVAVSERSHEPDLQPVLLTIEETAQSLRIGRSMVCQLVKTGELRSVKIGASRRVPVAAVNEYADSLRAS